MPPHRATHAGPGSLHGPGSFRGSADRLPAGPALAVVVAAVVAGAVVLSGWRHDAESTIAVIAALALLAVTVGLGRHAWATAHQLADARRTLTSLALTTHELLWRTDARGRLTWTNDVSRELLGYRPAELVGRPVLDLVDPETLPLLREHLTELSRTGAYWRDVPQRVLHRDGRVLLLEASGRPVIERGGVVGYEGTARPMHGARAEAHRLADERRLVSRLLGTDAVEVAFQPIVHLSSGSVIGFEALTRFSRVTDASPETCFARAWEVGLGVALELQSFRAALAALPWLPDDLYMSINASPRTVLDPAFADLVLTGHAPLHRIVLEITEHESIDDYAALLDALAYARCRGMRLAVDDAGSGYASFRHIVKLRPDHIKLDRDLVAGIDADPARRALASAVVVFALELDATVIAEGVETPAQLDTLSSLSVDAAQGFYLGRPVVGHDAWQAWRRASWCVPGRDAGTGLTA